MSGPDASRINANGNLGYPVQSNYSHVTAAVRNKLARTVKHSDIKQSTITLCWRTGAAPLLREVLRRAQRRTEYGETLRRLKEAKPARSTPMLRTTSRTQPETSCVYDCK